MPGEFILSIDQGTTNTKALLVDRRGEAVFRASMTLGILRPQRGFVEQDPVEIWKSVLDCCKRSARGMRESPVRQSQESQSATSVRLLLHGGRALMKTEKRLRESRLRAPSRGNAGGLLRFAIGWRFTVRRSAKRQGCRLIRW